MFGLSNPGEKMWKGRVDRALRILRQLSACKRLGKFPPGAEKERINNVYVSTIGCRTLQSYFKLTGRATSWPSWMLAP